MKSMHFRRRWLPSLFRHVFRRLSPKEILLHLDEIAKTKSDSRPATRSQRGRPSTENTEIRKMISIRDEFHLITS